MKKTVNEIVSWLKGLAKPESRLCLDSRALRAGDIFVAIPGLVTDGRRFVNVAQARGAAAVLFEAQGALPVVGLPALGVEDLSAMLGDIAGQFYGDPSQALTGIAVTGTNGKTTTTHWIAELLNAGQMPCAILGTVGCRLGTKTFDAPALTTPDALSLQGLLADLKTAGAQAFAIEASSAGLDRGRLQSVTMRVAVFTNLTRDHLDYHETMEAYGEAKARLFSQPGLTHAVINADDPASERMAEAAREAGLTIWSTSLTGETPAWAHEHWTAQVLSHGANGMELAIGWQGNRHTVHLRQIGRFNAENALEALAASHAAGLALETGLVALSQLTSPPGRMEALRAPYAPTAVVDYCHTPDAMEKTLASLRDVVPETAHLWVVFGCGGDRDPGKRPMMGDVAERLADRVILTNDNPRSEEPEAILREVAQGTPSAAIVPDRKAAVAKAIGEASPQDVVLVCGKGHEAYQEIKGIKYPYSDLESIREAFNDVYVREHRACKR